jgi:hypothetical protein
MSSPQQSQASTDGDLTVGQKVFCWPIGHLHRGRRLQRGFTGSISETELRPPLNLNRASHRILLIQSNQQFASPCRWMDPPHRDAAKIIGASRDWPGQAAAWIIRAMQVACLVARRPNPVSAVASVDGSLGCSEDQAQLFGKAVLELSVPHSAPEPTIGVRCQVRALAHRSVTRSLRNSSPSTPPRRPAAILRDWPPPGGEV